MLTIEETIEFVKKKHSETNSLDKSGKTPYYWHLLRVMLRIKNATYEQSVVALLHDILEDTNTTKEELTQLFGDNITQKVIWLSKNFFPKLNFKEWSESISLNAPQDSLIVKLSDVSDNLSFERMNGLIPTKNNVTNKEFIPFKNLPIQKRIDIITSKKLKLKGEMGVYKRYYQAWNIFMNEEKNKHLINGIDTGDFIALEQLKKLSQYIPKNEFINYLSNNNINTWSIQGDIKVIFDRVGNPYIAAVINHDIGQIYQNLLTQELKVSEDFANNQHKRDSGHFHITIVNSAELNLLQKTKSLDSIVELFTNCSNHFYSYGIGTQEKKENKTFFTVLSNEYITTQRNKLELKPHDLHMTLGFKDKDIHGVPKNKNTVVLNNSEIWKNWVANNKLTTQTEKKNKFSY